MELSHGLPRRTLALFASIIAALGLVLLLSSHRAEADPTLSDAQQKVDELSRQMDSTNEQLNAAQVTLDQSQQRQAKLQGDLGSLQQQYGAAHDRVGKLGASAYENGRQLGVSTVLLTSSSSQSMLDSFSYLEYLNYRQQTSIDKLKKSRSDLTHTKKEIDAEVATQQQKKQELSDKKSQLQKDLADWQQKRAALTPRSSSAAQNASYVEGTASGDAALAVKYAYAQLGKPYVFGADGPDSFDCSGLTMAAWQQAGVHLQHSAENQFSSLAKVSNSNLQPGDLVSFYSSHEHVGIYVGGGKVIHAPQPGENVKIAPMSSMPASGYMRP